MHAKATVNGTTIAETDHFEFVEGNVYFPVSSVKNSKELFVDSPARSQCPWKGEAHYYDVHLNGETIDKAAWYYPRPLEKALHIKDTVAFGEW